MEESRSARKHRAIMEAATTVFLQKGYLGTSMDEVAALATVSKQTVYKHFADKEQLFAEIIRSTLDRAERLVDEVSSALHDIDDVEKGLGELARRFLTVLMEPEFLRLRRLVIGEAGRFPELGHTWYERGFERVLATLGASLETLAARGQLRLDDPLLAAYHFAGLILWIPMNRVMFGGEGERLTEAEAERLADAGVRAFMAAYGGDA
jgi:TetR/AcrR family transcriptional repressor of mexJK operon